MNKTEIIEWLTDIFPDKINELDAAKIADEWVKDVEDASSEMYDEGYNDGRAECDE